MLNVHGRTKDEWLYRVAIADSFTDRGAFLCSPVLGSSSGGGDGGGG